MDQCAPGLGLPEPARRQLPDQVLQARQSTQARRGVSPDHRSEFLNGPDSGERDLQDWSVCDHKALGPRHDRDGMESAGRGLPRSEHRPTRQPRHRLPLLGTYDKPETVEPELSARRRGEVPVSRCDYGRGNPRLRQRRHVVHVDVQLRSAADTVSRAGGKSSVDLPATFANLHQRHSLQRGDFVHGRCGSGRSTSCRDGVLFFGG